MRPTPDGSQEIKLTEGPYGVPDMMLHGYFKEFFFMSQSLIFAKDIVDIAIMFASFLSFRLQSSKAKLGDVHPLEFSERNVWSEQKS